MGDFVRQQHFGKEGIEAGIAQISRAVFLANVGNVGQIDETWKALAEVTFDRRNRQRVNAERLPARAVVIENAGGLFRQERLNFRSLLAKSSMR